MVPTNERSPTEAVGDRVTCSYDRSRSRCAGGCQSSLIAGASRRSGIAATTATTAAIAAAARAATARCAGDAAVAELHILDDRDAGGEGDIAAIDDRARWSGGEGIAAKLAMDPVGGSDDQDALVIANARPVAAVVSPRVGLNGAEDEVDEFVGLLLFGAALGIVALVTDDVAAATTATAASATAAAATTTTTERRRRHHYRRHHRRCCPAGWTG
jgi:hypothetical protein